MIQSLQLNIHSELMILLLNEQKKAETTNLNNFAMLNRCESITNDKIKL